jgi:hypothetical protein
MAQELINVGTTAGDGTGEALGRGTWQKINRNFTEVYASANSAGTQRLFRERGPLVERFAGNIRTVLDGKPVTQRVSQSMHVLNHADGYVQTPNMIFTGGRITAFYAYATNGTNKAIFAWQRVGNVVTIGRCANGSEAWTDVLSYTGSTPDALPNIMCDCGNDRMLYVEYGAAGSNRIWGSVDNGQNWGNNAPAYDNDLPLITEVGIISHFHGVVYDPVTDAVVIMTGDSNPNSRMLYCDDIADLFANPSTWKTRWGLDSVGQQMQRDYCLNDNLVGGLPNSQAYRAVSSDFTTVGDQRYIVWSEDAANSGGQFIYAQNITAGPTQNKITIGPQIGANWIVKTLSNGVVVIAANSEAAGIPNAGHDVFLRLYAVRPDLSGVDVISRSRRSDFASPVGSAVWWFLGEVYGRMLASTSYADTTDGNTILGFVGGAGEIFRQDDSLPSDQYQVVTAPTDKRNLVANGRFLVDTADWTGLTGCTIARDTVNKPNNEVASLRIIPSAGVTLASVSFGFTALQRLHWGGQLVTFRFYYRINGSVGTQNPGFFYNFGNNQSQLFTLVNTSGAWVEFIAAAPIPINATAFEVWWYATRTGAEAGRELSIADVSINLGTTINNRGVTP